MKIPTYPLILCYFLLASALQAQTKSDLPINPDVKIGKLENGLTYYIQSNKKPEKRVELRLAVKAGSLQEDENQKGLAHFVEHMAFNGTRNFEKNKLIDYLESTGLRFGPDLNAYTSFEETVYMLQARTDSIEYLEKALLILEDWAGGISFSPEEIDKERGVVISEWRSRLSPQQRLQQQYLPVLYKDSRYAERLPIGDPKIIENAPYEVIKAYYQDWYRPDLMAIIAVGDVDLEWMEQEIINRFGKIASAPQSRVKKEYDIPSHKDTRFAILSDPEVAFTEIELVIKHPELKVNNPESLRKFLTHTLYNRMLNSRMQEIQRLPDPPFTFAYSGYGGDLGPLDAYRISAFVKEGAYLEGLAAVLKATRQAQLYGFNDSELQRQKKELLSALESSYKEKDKISSAIWASRNLQHFISGGLLLSPEQNLQIHKEILPGIKVEDINQLPNQWLKSTDRVFIVTGPKKEDVPLPTEQDLLQLLDSINQLDLTPFQDNVIEAPLLDTVLTEVPIIKENQILELGITEWTLENGVKVVLKPTKFQNDEILFSSFSPGGHSIYPDTIFRSADIAAFLVTQSGIGKFGYLEKEKALAGKQVRIAPYISEWYEGTSGSTEVQELETLLQLNYLYFTAPRKEEVLFQSYLKRQESIVQNMYNNPYYHFANLKNRLKYGTHPRKQTIKMEEVKKMNLDWAHNIYQDRFADASDFIFFFVGNFQPDSIKSLVSTYLGNLPSTNRKENWKDTQSGLLPGLIDTIVYKGQAEKSLVEIIYHGPFDAKKDSRFHFSAMTSIFRDRLREKMREEKGGVYTVNVRPAAPRVPQSMYRITISFNCQPDEAMELIEIINTEIRKIKEESISVDELNTVKEKIRQSRILSLKENQFWMSQLVARYKYGLPLENILLENLNEQLETLSPEDVLNAANSFLSRENYIELILLPERYKNN